MPRPIKPPSYLKGKSRSNRAGGGHYARTVIDGREVPLGVYGSPESHQEFERVCAEWRAAQADGGSLKLVRAVTVDGLIACWFRHVETEGLYRGHDGKPTTEVVSWSLSVGPLTHLYGNKPARDFGPLALKAVRQAMLDGSWLNAGQRERRRKRGLELGWCRKTTNQRVRRIVRLFAHGVSEQLVPVEVLQALQAVAPLAAGSRKARDYPDIEPVPVKHVTATLRCLKHKPAIHAMILVQMLTGMRPGEVCSMRVEEIDRRGLLVGDVRVWAYRPGGGDRHKTAKRGVKRAVALGPRVQRILQPFLEGREAGAVFSPLIERERRFAAMRAARKTPVQPSQQCRKRPQGKRLPRECYDTSSYDHAVLAACRAAGVPEWSANQLRKLGATLTEQHNDLDTARAQLGHTTSQTTKRYYAKADLKKAAKAAAKLG